MIRNKVFVFLFLILGQCYCANILAIFPLPSLSHFVMFGKVLKELAERGHEVDVVTHFSSMLPIEVYNDISIRGSSEMFTNNFSYNLVADFTLTDTIYFITENCGVEICKNSFQAENMQKLKSSTKKYDLVITELFSSDCMLGWAWHFNVPSVVMTSSANLPWGSERFGLPDNPSYIPTYFVEYEAKMTLYERIFNTFSLVEGKLLYYFLSEKPSNAIAKQFFGDDMPDLDVLARNSSLHLLNTHFSINNARPLVPNVVEVAGIHIEEPKPVNEHFQKILETDKRGIIYLTTGSLILSETFPATMLQGMFDAFAELPYKVLWKAKKENFPKGLKFPSNIHFEPWMTQLDILCDPRVKLFVSHGGMMGTQEAVYCGVPIIGIPVFADQKLNIRHAETMGYAIALNFESVTKDSLLTAAKKILHDPIYAENAKRISEEFKDRPSKPLDTAIYWIEYVIRHKGAPGLQSPGKYLPWYQYYLMDVIAVIVAVPCILVYLIVVLVKLVFGQSKTKTKIKTK